MCSSDAVNTAVNPFSSATKGATSDVLKGVQGGIDLVRNKGDITDKKDIAKQGLIGAGAMITGPGSVGMLEKEKTHAAELAVAKAAAIPPPASPQASRQVDTTREVSRRVTRRNRAKFARSGTIRTSSLGANAEATGKQQLLGD